MSSLKSRDTTLGGSIAIPRTSILSGNAHAFELSTNKSRRVRVAIY